MRLPDDWKPLVEQIEQALKNVMPAATPNLLLESCRYSLLSGGKRLRPLMCLLVAKAFKAELNMVLPYACAVEMIHTYSLIHDDLPAMDDDDLRRGRPTNHKVFGEAIAILAGNALQNEAYQIVINAARSYPKQQPAYLHALNELAKSAGALGLLAGQVRDIHERREPVSEDELLLLFEQKTATLFMAAVVGGAMLSGASVVEQRILRQFALHFGLAFQFADDLADDLTEEPVAEQDGVMRHLRPHAVHVHGRSGAAAQFQYHVAQARQSLANPSLPAQLDLRPLRDLLVSLEDALPL